MKLIDSSYRLHALIIMTIIIITTIIPNIATKIREHGDRQYSALLYSCITDTL